jgi:Tfp pilus assembly protein PilF
LEPANHGIYAELLYESNRKKDALAELKQALSLDPSYEWAWNTYLNWSREYGESESPVNFMRKLIKAGNRNVQLRLRLAESYFASGDHERGLRSLKKALQLDPQFVEAYDLMARHYAQGGNYKRALACCRPKEISEVPVQLRIREAWINLQQGDYQNAVQKLKQILEHNPDSFEGWQMLLEGLWDQDLYPELEKTAQQMSALFPFHPVPFGYLGAAHLKRDQNEAARKAFQKAFSLDRSYFYAGCMLFDLELKRKEIQKAREILDSIIRQVGESNIEVAARQAHLAVEENNENQAGVILRSLCLVYFDDDWPVESTVQMMEEAGWEDRVWATISQLISNPNINPCAARIWARYSTKYNLRSSLSKINSVDYWSRSGAYLVTLFTDEVCKAFQSIVCQSYNYSFYEYRSIILQLFRRYYSVIKMYPESWTLVTRSLLYGGYVEKVRSKLDAWQDYTNTTTQRFATIVVANYLCSRLEKARQALTYTRNRIAQSNYSIQPQENFQPLFELFDRVLDAGYSPVPAEAFNFKAQDPLIPFFQTCLQFLDLLREYKSKGRRIDQGAVALFQSNHPEAWYMKRLLGFLLKRFKKKLVASNF